MTNIFSKISLTKYAVSVAIVMAFLAPAYAQAFVTTSGLPFAMNNLIPGGSVSGSFSIENTTGIDQQAAIQVASTTGDFALFEDQITYEISGDFASSGNLGDLLGMIDLSEIPNGSTHDYTLTLTLKSDAPQNPLMGKTFGFDIILGFEDGTITVPGGGGGGGNGNNNNDDDNNEDNDPPPGLVAGTSTPFGMGGGQDLWEDLLKEIADAAAAARGAVLGEDAEAQEEVSSTTEETEDVSKDDAAMELGALSDWLCDYLWLLPLLWIIASALAYWRKESYGTPAAMFWTQIIFGGLSVILILTYMITGVPCSWLPSAIVAIGASVMSYFGREA